jgi:hypothetical protein
MEEYTQSNKKQSIAGQRCLTPVILATQEAEIRRIVIQFQPWVNCLWEPILKKPHHKKEIKNKKGLVEWLKQ